MYPKVIEWCFPKVVISFTSKEMKARSVHIQMLLCWKMCWMVKLLLALHTVCNSQSHKHLPHPTDLLCLHDVLLCLCLWSYLGWATGDSVSTINSGMLYLAMPYAWSSSSSHLSRIPEFWSVAIKMMWVLPKTREMLFWQSTSLLLDTWLLFFVLILNRYNKSADTKTNVQFQLNLCPAGNLCHSKYQGARARRSYGVCCIVSATE